MIYDKVPVSAAQNLFDPINPDKDTKETRLLTRRDRLDTEFFLLQRLADLVERANFRELSRTEVEAALKPHNTRQGVKVRFPSCPFLIDCTISTLQFFLFR